MVVMKVTMAGTSSTRSFVLCFIVVIVLATCVLMMMNTKQVPWRLCDSSQNDHNPAVKIGSQGTHLVSEQSRALFVFTGRWEYLRVSLPYFYRDLKQNGGVLDKVLFMMLQYNNETYTKLNQFTTASNKLLKEEVFELRFLDGNKPGEHWRNAAHLSYSQFFTDVINNPYNQYLKVDDDVVYYHPDAFKKMFANKDSSNCFMHFGNIAGTNWRCSITHQRMGLFNDEVNPKNLKFDFDPNGKCGWESPECAEVTLQAFIHYYKKQQLDKYLFNGLELLPDRKRFSINFFLFDKDLIRVKELMEAGPISSDDEGWWTMTYAPKPSIEQPNCIVGEALVVHFSYFTTQKRMLELGYLKEFEKIAQLEVGSKMPQSLWKLLNY